MGNKVTKTTVASATASVATGAVQRVSSVTMASSIVLGAIVGKDVATGVIDVSMDSGVAKLIVGVGATGLALAGLEVFLRNKVLKLCEMSAHYLDTGGMIQDEDYRMPLQISYLSHEDRFEIVLGDGDSLGYRAVFTTTPLIMQALLDAIQTRSDTVLCAAFVRLPDVTDELARTWSVSLSSDRLGTTVTALRMRVDDEADAILYPDLGKRAPAPTMHSVETEQVHQFMRAQKGGSASIRSRSRGGGRDDLSFRIPANLAKQIARLRETVKAAAAATNVSAWLKPSRLLLLKN